MFQRCDFFLSFLGLSTYQPQHKVSCQCGIMTLLSVHLFIYLWWWQGSGTCSACSEIVRGLISWHFRRGLRPSHSLQFGLNSGNDYQSVCVCVCVCVCVALVRAECCHPSARHCCEGGMFKTWQTSLVTWHPGPSPASRSSSLAYCVERLEGRMWEASLNSRDGLPCCSRGPSSPAAIKILTFTHTQLQHSPWTGWRHSLS